MTATKKAAPCWNVYVLRCADDSLYTGIATDVNRRLDEHRHSDRGAKYLRGRGPLALVFCSAADDRSHASRLEKKIKQLPKLKKEALLRTPARFRRLLADW
ncbi:MAG: GIY-YIG nuclease family protein [Halioglobus sp.]|nr:GIY-YIG nuclease family protein [Halioglobus sp.]